MMVFSTTGFAFAETDDETPQTESTKMVWINEWTLLIICTFVLQLIVDFLLRHKEYNIENEGE